MLNVERSKVLECLDMLFSFFGVLFVLLLLDVYLQRFGDGEGP